MQSANLPDNVLYLETFTFKLAKHKMATKMLRNPHIFYSLSHINAQFMVSARFLINNFFLVTLEKIDPYLTFRYKTSSDDDNITYLNLFLLFVARNCSIY